MKVTDQSLEQLISRLLLTGVSLSGIVVLAGGICFLLQHGNDPVDYRIFHPEPLMNRITSEIAAGVIRGRSQSIIQFGILLLIATPVARVACALIGFSIERDRIYVLVTAIVLAILLYSLISGGLA